MLPEKAGRTGVLQKRLDARVAELKSARTESDFEESVMKEVSSHEGRQQVKMGVSFAAIGPEGTVIHDFTKRV